MMQFLRSKVWAHLPDRVKPKDRRMAVVLWGGGLAALAAFLHFWRGRIGLNTYVGMNAGAVTLAVALMIPGLGDKVYLGVLRFFAIFGYFIGRFILAAAFYLGVTPLAIVFRLTGRKFLDAGFGRPPAPAWRVHKTSDDPGRFYRQF